MLYTSHDKFQMGNYLHWSLFYCKLDHQLDVIEFYLFCDMEYSFQMLGLLSCFSQVAF